MTFFFQRLIYWVNGFIFWPLINFVNRISIVRWFIDKMIGIHKDRKLPELATLTFEKWFKNHRSVVKDPIDKVVILVLVILIQMM